jgi:hypothetical protein
MAAPICVTCNLERSLISIKPVKNRHEMLQYECASCRDIFCLVTERAPLEPEDLVDITFDRPALQAAAQ